VAFDRFGRLVTTCYDGFVRLYEADRYDKPIARVDTLGRLPFSAAFSPDGTRVAVGYSETSDVVVLSSADLKPLFKANTTGVPETGADLNKVSWSQDGRYLFAGGSWVVKYILQVRRWINGGRGAYADIPTAPNRIMQILGLKDGRTLFASVENFGVIQPDARSVQLHAFGALNLIGRRGAVADLEEW